MHNHNICTGCHSSNRAGLKGMLALHIVSLWVMQNVTLNHYSTVAHCSEHQ
jgi:hypothetical protein